jgi:hypothetical protein
MSTLNVAALQDVDAAGSKATLPTTGANFTLGPGWGALEFVAEAAITGGPTNVDVTSLAAGYSYLFSIESVGPATDSVTMHARMSQSTTFLTGGSDYSTQQAPADHIKISTQVRGGAAGETGSYLIYLPSPGRAGVDHTILPLRGVEDYTDGDKLKGIVDGGGIDLNQTAVDGIRFYWSSGVWQNLGHIITLRWRNS